MRRSVVTGWRLVANDPATMVAGPAYTLRQAPKSRAVAHDENLTRQRFVASEQAEPGDVIVIDVYGRTDVSTWGENQSMAAQHRGIAGLIVNGAVRDSARIRQLGFPVLCRGHSPVASRWDLETVELSEPLVIDGVRIRPADIVCGDADGLVVIPAEQIDDVYARAAELVQQEESARNQKYGRGQ